MAVVVDTDVISYIFKEDSRTVTFEQHLVDTPKFISFMTLAELRRWQLQSGWGEAKTLQFEAMIEDYGVIFADNELCMRWAEVTFDCSRKGIAISASDAWVAAAALMFDIPLVTNNKKHFQGITDLVLL